MRANSENQSKKMTAIKTVDGNPVTVQPHRTMNRVVGTVYSETLSKSTTGEILEKLADCGVSKVERMKKRVKGELVETHRHIITFNRTKLPSLIKMAEWHMKLLSYTSQLLYVAISAKDWDIQRIGVECETCVRVVLRDTESWSALGKPSALTVKVLTWPTSGDALTIDFDVRY